MATTTIDYTGIADTEGVATNVKLDVQALLIKTLVSNMVNQKIEDK